MAEIIVENIGQQLTYNMAVYDVDGNKIGSIIQYDANAGYFQTEKGILFLKDRYIPFSAIAYIDTSGVHLSVSKDYVKDMYDAPPVVDVDAVIGPDGAAAVGTVASGYDGSRLVVDSATLGDAIDRLALGLKVYDSTGQQVGTIAEYDPQTGWMTVEKGVFVEHNLYIPITAVEYFDASGAYLRVTKEALKDGFVVAPTDVTFVNAVVES